MNETAEPVTDVLLVEDEPADVHLTRMAFEEAGVTARLHHVNDGREALRFLAGEPPYDEAPQPGLILLDLNMPHMGGLEFLQRLRETDQAEEVPVVVLSTSDLERDIQASHQNGAADYLVKPLDMEQFCDRVQQLAQDWNLPLEKNTPPPIPDPAADAPTENRDASSKAPREDGDHATSPAGSGGDGVPVLLVEDEPGDADLVRFGLRGSAREHFDVTRVDRLSAVPQALDEVSPAVVLLDLSLPDSTGLDTVRAAREWFRDTPIIVLTGYDDEDFALRTLEAGAADYLVKGRIETSTLGRAIRYARSRASLEGRVRESEARMAAALEGAHLGLWDWRVDRDSMYYDRRWGELTGLADAEGYGPVALWDRVLHPEDRERRDTALQRHLKGETSRYSAEFRVRHPSGSEAWLLDAGQVIERDRDQHARRMVGVVQDITEHKRMEQRLETLARTDPLTGLANRRLFMDELEREYARMRREPGYAAGLLMLDIDHFKRFNDRYGHETGDQVLVEFADCIASALRAGDRAARLGGEEFAILLHGASLGEAGHTAERVRARVEAMEPQPDRPNTTGVTTSIGVTILRADDRGADDALRRADDALYAAKSRGRNCVVVNGSAREEEPPKD
ncbi:diguanylate cyclase domain-containing protein [Thioalkalivibrio sp. ALgr3]|uniref:diguanylate cyclase domain-containing protein n=1 Tax=Thioalkalivibrio sp. ALgr3 TaxID=1239292 RepID=UPI00037C5C71|nr:diguanylate cyclase [Thioalkalivibrio sp. ALgr3]